MASLTDDYHISDESLALRRRFLRLGSRDVATLRSLAGWAERHADDIAREFYDHEFAFEPTRRFFDKYAAKRGMSVE